MQSLAKTVERRTLRIGTPRSSWPPGADRRPVAFILADLLERPKEEYRESVAADLGGEAYSSVGRTVDATAPVRRVSRKTQRARRHTRQFWRRWGWGLVVLLAVVGFALGAAGYGSVYAHNGILYTSSTAAHFPRLSWPDRLYYSLLLFKFEIAIGPPYSAWLEVARWLAPLTTAYAGYRVIADIFSDRWARFRASRMLRGHVVVCGLGRCGLRIATADWGMPVVAIEHAPSATDIEHCRERGVVLIVGEATDPVVLGQVGLGHAKYLFVVCGDDGVNAEVGLLAREIVDKRHPPLECFVPVYDERACDLLQKATIADAARESVNFEFFNIYRSGPRALLDVYGPALLTDNDGPAPQVVVVGSRRLGLNVLIESARRWSLQPATPGEATKKLRCVLVALDAARQCSELEQRYPDLAGVSDLVACESDPSDPDSENFGLEEVASYNGPSTAFVCLDDDPAGLRATIRLRDVLPGRIGVVLCTTGHSDIARLLRLAGRDEPLNVNGFGLLDQVCRPEVLLNGDRERIAQAMHGEYVRAQTVLAQPADDISMQPWQMLPESLRESNRDQAADIGRKLKEVGLDLVLTSSWGPAQFTFTPEEMDLLSREEHDRWMRKLLADGWTMGPEKNVESRIHPLLVPWEELSQAEKDKDANAVRALPALLARSGYAIVSRNGSRGPAA
jgi:hypothetical protein